MLLLHRTFCATKVDETGSFIGYGFYIGVGGGDVGLCGPYCPQDSMFEEIDFWKLDETLTVTGKQQQERR